MSDKKRIGLFSSLGADFPAAIVVFLVALPLCLGIALGSGAPLFAGLIGGIVGGIVIGSLSGSQLSVSGPAAGLTSIVLVAIAKLQVYEAFLLAVVIAGIFQVILGFLRAGILGDYVPYSVIKGMLAAIGIILILGQLPHFLGHVSDDDSVMVRIWEALKNITPVALFIGVLSIGIQVFWDKVLVKKGRIFKLIPAPLIVVLLAIGINEWLKINQPALALHSSKLVSIPAADSFNEFISFFTFPDLSYLGNFTVWSTAITIALVASLETLLNIEAADELDPYQRVTPTNRELKAQGAGNMLSGLIGGLPLTSVIVRTSANVNAGGKTKMSTIIHGLLLLGSVAFIPTILNLIPLAGLAGILIYTGYKLAKPDIFKEMKARGMDQLIPFVVTILAILLTDLLVGILIGCVIGLLFVMRSNFKSAVFVVNDENRYLFRLRKDVSFLNKPIIKRRLEQVPKNAHVVIDAARADYIDKDVIEVIEDFITHAPLKNINVELRKSVYKDQGFTTRGSASVTGSIKEIMDS